jgi:hypothetical protein
MNDKTTSPTASYKKICRLAGCICGLCVIIVYSLFLMSASGGWIPVFRAAFSVGAIVSAFVCVSFAVIGLLKK